MESRGQKGGLFGDGMVLDGSEIDGRFRPGMPFGWHSMAVQEDEDGYRQQRSGEVEGSPIWYSE